MMIPNNILQYLLIVYGKLYNSNIKLKTITIIIRYLARAVDLE